MSIYCVWCPAEYCVFTGKPALSCCEYASWFIRGRLAVSTIDGLIFYVWPTVAKISLSKTPRVLPPCGAFVHLGVALSSEFGTDKAVVARFWPWLSKFTMFSLTDSRLVGSTDFHSSHPQGHQPTHHALGGVPREQGMLKGHLARVIYHQVYQYTMII